jgi:hypothetical protein
MSIRDDFGRFAQATRRDVNQTDLQVAQKITNAWTDANQQISTLYQQLQAARRARIEVLEQTVPIGPGIPADASPADATVMNQAFRAALERARNAKQPQAAQTISSGTSTGYDPETLTGMLIDAEKFNDDTLRRAVLTAAVETGQTNLVRSWTDKMGLTSQLDELERLTSATAGRGFDGVWDYKAFTPIPKPDEVSKLIDLEKAEQVATQARVTQERALAGTASWSMGYDRAPHPRG